MDRDRGAADHREQGHAELGQRPGPDLPDRFLDRDDNYLFTVRQSVKNASDHPVELLPWSRVRRDYQPVTSGYYILHEGMLGYFDGSLKETTYPKAKSEGDKKGGIALEADTDKGWAGITDKYWLVAMIPNQSVPARVFFRHIEVKGAVHPGPLPGRLRDKECGDRPAQEGRLH